MGTKRQGPRAPLRRHLGGALPLLGLAVVACGGAPAPEPATGASTPHAAPASATAEGPATAPEPRPGPAGELLPGTKCVEASLPSWTYDASERRARLSGSTFAVRIPVGWEATVERPELVLVTAPPDASGVRPTFELFVSPVCETYDLPRVHRRVAARAMTALLPADATAKQVAKGRWAAGLGGAVGKSIILFDVALDTPEGERLLVLYGTDVGASKTVSVHAAAACPKERRNDRAPGPCEAAYVEMLESAQ